MKPTKKPNTLKKYRESLGLSQEELSKKLNLSQGTVSRIETGRSYGKGFIIYLKFLVENDFDMNDYFRSWEGEE
ncbi:helix-turn-helix transcriptional regulator [Flagellimonas sp.]|uniref:helix-turn-helix transcriptional regulator n=1 Tax=Flagellimonas sp. TaxID=2058762 RepID=UPI003BA8FC6C